MTYVIGHKNPDADSIVSAIALAYFLDATPAKLGAINPETAFILKTFNIAEPNTLNSAAGAEIFLVDHAERAQSIDDLEQGTLVGIIDHHKVGISTPYPIIYICKPLGSTASIISELYFRKNLDYIGAKQKELSRSLAGLLLSAILSDTVLFKSPTTTDLDRELAIQLAAIAGIDDLESYGMAMLKEKSSVSKLSPTEIFYTDYKEFSIGGASVAISQVEVIDSAELTSKRGEILRIMDSVCVEKKLDLLLFVITNVMEEGSEFLVCGNKKIFEAAFSTKLNENSAHIPGIMSRKKQIVPMLEKAYCPL